MSSFEVFWLFANHDKKFQEQMKWMANILMYIGLVILFLVPASKLIGYASFLAAYLIWMFFAWKSKDNPLFAQFLFYIPLYSYAIYITL